MTDFLCIKWIEDNAGEDWIPMQWIEREGSQPDLVHDVYWRRNWHQAKCDVSCHGRIVELDYSKHRAFNEARDMLLGLTRVHFRDLERQRPLERKLQWADHAGAKFRTFPKSPVSVKDDTEFDIAQIKKKKIPATTRKQLIDARCGQGQFRSDVMAQWNRACAVTGIAIDTVLRASHIKPWRDSSNKERLNPSNGLLLCANLDALFDRHLITFSDNGKMEICGEIGEQDLAKLGVPQPLRQALTNGQKKFIGQHRERARGAA